MLTLLSVWIEVQMICIWSSWYQCHPSLSCFTKIQNDLPFWYRLTHGKETVKRVEYRFNFVGYRGALSLQLWKNGSRAGYGREESPQHSVLLWPPYVIGQAALCNRADHYIFALWFLSSIFYLLSIYLSFFPRLISAAAGWMSTILWHMVWP